MQNNSRCGRQSVALSEKYLGVRQTWRPWCVRQTPVPLVWPGHNCVRHVWFDDDESYEDQRECERGVKTPPARDRKRVKELADVLRWTNSSSTTTGVTTLPEDEEAQIVGMSRSYDSRTPSTAAPAATRRLDDIPLETKLFRVLVHIASRSSQPTNDGDFSCDNFLRNIF